MTLRNARAAVVLGLLAGAAVLPRAARAVALDLATLTCSRYQNEVMNPPAPPAGASANLTSIDPINTMMWLFGFSVAKSGAHVMYGDALAGFGFALDGQCKNHPDTLLLDALTAVKPKQDNPMDLMTLTCETFEARHAQLKAKDAESADTLMMWLFGYASERTSSHILDASALPAFESELQKRCADRPRTSLFDAMMAPDKRLSVPKKISKQVTSKKVLPAATPSP